MLRRQRSIRLFLVASLLGGAALLPACTRTDSEASAWVPFAQADFVTIGRSTDWVLIRGARTDVLIYETENLYGGQPTDRLTWLIEFDADSPLQSALTVGPESATRGWLLETIEGRATHMAPLRGTVSISQRSAETLSAIVNVYAATDPPTVGEASGDRARLARRVEYARRVPVTIGAPDLETRGGVETLVPAKKRSSGLSRWW